MAYTRRNETFIVSTVLVVVLSAIVAGCAACSSVRASWAVRSFAKDAGGVIAEQYDSKAKEPDIMTQRLQQAIAESADYASLLQTVYGPEPYAYRFVVAQKLTEQHKQLNARIDQLRSEGFDPAPYRLEQRTKWETLLNESLAFLASLPGTSLDQAESAKLTDALSAAALDDFSPDSILTFAAKPVNKGKFPSLQEMLTKAKDAAKNRDTAIVQLEALDAVNFMRHATDMVMDTENFSKFWEDSKSDMAGTLKKMIPLSPHYAALKKELARFRKLAKMPQPPTFTRRQHAKKGSKNKALVTTYQERFKFEGYWDGPVDGEFDEAFEQAIYKYQEDRQVTPDGKIEARTIERLNVPMSDRVKQLKIALQKLRNSPTRGSDYFLRVNLGSQELEVYRDNGGTIVRRHRIIIGNRIGKNHTPEFSDEIEKIVINPPWLVPQRIIKEEMLPQFVEDPDWFKKKGYVAKVVYEEDGETIKKIAAVTQPPGRGNALGVVKILFPNRHSVYLHDTPTKYLFKRALRTYSHGCMRLQDPVDVAKYLLAQDENPGLKEFDDLLESRRQKTIHLLSKVPIHMVYVTVTSNEEGKAVFFTDPYKREEELMEAISAD
ncbi:MAG: L,D-transpeptidase family protein [Candidatus Lernaella stagnicola]|nr:L,D-transpeptidase family protein [Candidatus Lernaella stagnicola]